MEFAQNGGEVALIQDEMEGNSLSNVGSRTLAQVGHAANGRLVVASRRVDGHRQRAVPASGERNDVVQEGDVAVSRVRDGLVAVVGFLGRHVVVEDPVGSALGVAEMPLAILAVDAQVGRARGVRCLRQSAADRQLLVAAGRRTGLRFDLHRGELRRRWREEDIGGGRSFSDGRFRLGVAVVNDLNAGRQVDIVRVDGVEPSSTTASARATAATIATVLGRLQGHVSQDTKVEEQRGSDEHPPVEKHGARLEVR